MVGVSEITLIDCLALIATVLFKPSVKVKGKDVNIYWMVVLLGAIAVLICGYLSPREILAGLTTDSAINPIKILILFISMTTLSIFLDEIGMFRYLANVALAKAGTSQKRLFFYLFCMVSVLTVFTSNDIIILTFTPFICYFAKNARINPIPYLFGEFVAANTWSMMLVIGNPTNVYLATANGIGFGAYTFVMWLPTIFAGVTAYLVLYLIFRKDLSRKIEAVGDDVTISSKPLLMIGVAHLGVCTVLLVISSYLNFEMWSVTLAFSISLFVTVSIYKLFTGTKGSELRNTLKRAPWELIPFVISMFILVLALDKYEVTDLLAAFLGSGATILKYGVSSFMTANLINNIPMSVLFSSIITGLEGVECTKAIYSAVIGSNIGAFFTPLGALAGIMWSGILKKHEVKFGFKDYIKYGALISIPTLAAALIGLAVRL